MSTSTPAATAATTLQSKMAATIKRLAPSGSGFIAAAITTGIVYVANHVFHVTVGSTEVDAALSPFVGFLVASIANDATKATPAVAAEVVKVEADVDKDPLLKLLAATVESKIADPAFRADLTRLVLGELTNIGAVGPHLASAIVQNVDMVSAAVQPPVPPVNIAPGSPTHIAVLNANAPATLPNPNHPVA